MAVVSVMCACVPLPADCPAQPPPPGDSAANPLRPAPPPRGPELPRGGYSLFPTFQLVGFCGTPGAPALGELDGNLPAKAKKLEAYASKYAGTREVLPAFELIAVIVLAGPGGDGKYRRRVDDKVVDEYLRLARQSRGLLILNIQPGHSDFLSEVKHFEKYLREPDVGVDDKVVDEYLRLARQSRGLLILNIQPGHSDFLSEVKHFEKYLREPDVG